MGYLSSLVNLISYDGPVAQAVERTADNREVLGSNPSGPIFFKIQISLIFIFISYSKKNMNFSFFKNFIFKIK